MTTQSRRPALPRRVEIVSPTYQRSKAELEEGVCVDAAFEEPVQAFVRPTRIRYKKRPNLGR